MTSARIRILGPQANGGFTVEFRDQFGNTLAFRTGVDCALVLQRFHERIPYGIEVPDVEDMEFLPLKERR